MPNTSYFSLAGKVAIVTGAARGIGRATAERLAGASAAVVIADANIEAAQTAATEIAATHGVATLATATNITVWEDCQAMVAASVEKLGRLDILVNNAGVAGKDDYIWDMPVEEFRRVLDVDLTGLWMCCKAAVPVMRAAGRGRIINIASVAGKEGNPRMMAYSAAKAGVIGLTKSLAKEVAKDGVLVNAISPAVIETPILSQLTEQQVQYMLSRIPMGRVGQPQEVAALVHFLASDECSFSTGATFDISGGRTTY